VIRDRRGRIVENVDLIRAAEPGKDLTLSIDRRIQYLAYRELKAALLANQASSGSVVILDIPTGEILAMVNQPSYNPNSRAAANPGTHRNRAVTDVVEPGSVIKAFTVAAALENGVDPNIVIQTSPGTMPLAGHVIRDVHDYGPVTLERLLAKSSNIGATKLALGMDNAGFHDVLRRFGFGESTGSGFPGESSGVLSPPRGWGQLEKATISYGYGLSVTPLQIAQAYAAIANEGRLMPPTFVRDSRAPARQAIDPRVARHVLHLLESVTEQGGSATRAAITGYQVAGKTGTSRTFRAGGYDKKYISRFAGVVPVDHPKFATVVVIHNPRGHDYYGGLVSAPVFHNVMDGALRLMDVPPDHIDQWYASKPGAVATAGAGVALAANAKPATAAAVADAAEAEDGL
jgi:cell division protein FtsI (penicillin-binding protein 3)